ncbi:MAG: dihydropyrimidinase [Acidimicrobiia bacterium]|nr:dihydropyrimidinase [Acidimicrobiia bacterium]
MTFDLVVRNGRLVDAGLIRDGDIGIEAGRIAATGPDLADGVIELDAGGRFVMPGGVDSHVHLGQVSSKGDMTADDFWTGSRSAVFGGTTTVVPFAAQHRGQSIRQVVDDALQRAVDQMTIDYSLHVIITDFGGGAADELRSVAADGIAAVKIYLTYDRLKLVGSAALEVMSVAGDAGLPVMVHAEADSLVTWGRDRQVEAAEYGAASHAVSHSRAAEWSGVAEAIALAETVGATVYLAHVSTPEATELAVSARGRGVDVIAETCPHYLLLDEASLDAPMESAAPFLCSPPLRGADERAGLIDQLGSGIDLVASDHSPYTLDQKLPNGAETAFTEAANGLPGIELRLSLLYTAAIASGRFGMAEFVDLVSTNPAQACGLYPRKGSLQVGADADLVIWDPSPFSVQWSDLHDNVGYTPYEGMQLAGRPYAVVSAGEVLVADSTDRTRRGRGSFVPRRPPVR